MHLVVNLPWHVSAALDVPFPKDRALLDISSVSPVAAPPPTQEGNSVCKSE